MTPKPEAALALGKRDGHTVPVQGSDHLCAWCWECCSQQPGEELTVPTGLGCPVLQLGIGTGNDACLALEGLMGAARGC